MKKITKTIQESTYKDFVKWSNYQAACGQWSYCTAMEVIYLSREVQTSAKRRKGILWFLGKDYETAYQRCKLEWFRPERKITWEE